MMTKKRRRLLELLQESVQPLSAQQVYEQMEESLDMATVYRGLKYLEEAGEISSFLLDCSERGVERYYSQSSSCHRHFLHCVSCHSFTSLNECPLGSLEKIEKETGFRVEEHYLTLKGTCEKCQINVRGK
ncbi:MAG: Fur family transcriptional regulator [Spirochaetales bacterium]|nr:Fur family transcriptional regulator [Spirochaetales bacterium]